jgi:hypothetical protein
MFNPVPGSGFWILQKRRVKKLNLPFHCKIERATGNQNTVPVSILNYGSFKEQLKNRILLEMLGQSHKKCTSSGVRDPEKNSSRILGVKTTGSRNRNTAGTSI